MKIILFILFSLMFVGCGTIHTRTALSNTQVMMEYQVEASQELGQSDEMLTAGPKTKKFIQEMNAIGTVSQDGILPAQEHLDNQTKILGFGKADKAVADISVAGLKKDFAGSMGEVKFRNKMALKEVRNGWFAKLLKTMTDESWRMWLFGIASTFLTGGGGLMLVNKIRKKFKDITSENELHKKVAMNAIHYGKDMEEIALASGDETVDTKVIASQIKERRMVSMLDQHRDGTATHMTMLHGEVKIDRK